MFDSHPDPYRQLAERLDQLPNGFPPAADGVEQRLLAVLFSPEEAELAAQLKQSPEISAEVAERTGREAGHTNQLLKGMARRGLITCSRTERGLEYSLMPFVVGIYEMQVGRIDAELAGLFETYYRQAFGQVLAVQPQVHRVIPVQEAVPVGIDIQPYESASQILDKVKAWGVVDCICRKQKALIGDPCQHPLDVCMVLSDVPGAFNQSSAVRALTRQGAQETLERAARAGLVHSVSNNQKGVWYICNCCTCSCGVLRGLAELGIANVVARSAFVNQVDEARCNGCQTCLDACQFGALAFDLFASVDALRCVGCGVCVLVCPEDALSLAPRPVLEVQPPPVDESAWGAARSSARGLTISH